MGVRAGCYFLSSLLFIGCATAKFSVAPPPPTDVKSIQKADFSSLVVEFETFELFKVRESKTAIGWGWERPPKRDESKAGRGWYPGRLASTWAAYMTAHNDFGKALDPSVDLDLVPDLTLRAEARVNAWGNRTYYLDALVYPSFFVMPFTPEWGKAGVRVDLTATGSHGKVVFDRSVYVTAPYDILFYSWFRTGPTEEALMRAYAKAFEQLAIEFANERDEIMARLGRAQTPEVAYAIETDDLNPTSPSAAGDTEPIIFRLENDHLVHVVQEPKAREGGQGMIVSYLGALGGVRVTRFEGSAEVSSSVTEESGLKREIASGDATNTGYRISLYSVPKSTGFFIYPTFDWMDQRIDIADFREAVPIVDVAGAEEIQGVFSDPNTQQAIDITDPNTYSLNLRSTAVGQRMGLDFVLQVPSVQFFSTVEGGVGIVERRKADVRLGTHREVGSKWIWLGSYVAAGRVGFTVPKLHFSVSGTGEFRLYPEFNYPNPVEFRGRPRFNPEKQVNERPRSFVGAAKLQTLDLTLSLSYVF